ncbi:hypothetical protein ERHA55_51740 (plasmid) [Erwinia rhapontici]|nr:hypothetical protein ERHA55_51740 [Erwinia rhapontici]
MTLVSPCRPGCRSVSFWRRIPRHPAPGRAGVSAGYLLAVLIAFSSSLVGLRWLRNALQALPSLFISLPTFWLGIALIQVFPSSYVGSRLLTPANGSD